MPEGQAFPNLCKHTPEVLNFHQMSQELHLKLVQVVLRVIYVDSGNLPVEAEVQLRIIPDLQVVHALIQAAKIRQGGLP